VFPAPGELDVSNVFPDRERCWIFVVVAKLFHSTPGTFNPTVLQYVLGAPQGSNVLFLNRQATAETVVCVGEIKIETALGSRVTLRSSPETRTLNYSHLLLVTTQAENVVLTGRSTVTVTIAVGFRADQPRFLPLLVTMSSSVTGVPLASRRVTQSDLLLGEFTRLVCDCCF
jgi:hypothetical protein